MIKSNDKVNVSDIFRIKHFDVCDKNSNEKSAIDKAIESLCDEHRLFVEDILRCDDKEEIASEILKTCEPIEIALTTDKDGYHAPSPHRPILDKEQEDEISVFNIDVNYVDICLDISDSSKADEVFARKKDKLEKQIREIAGMDSDTIEKLEKCMIERDEIIVSQTLMHKSVLELCKSIRQIETDMTKINSEACITPQEAGGLVVAFDCKTEIQKMVKMQRKVDKVRNMAMLKGCHLLLCKESNKRIIEDNANLKEDLKELIGILKDLNNEYKKIQSDLCDSDASQNVSVRSSPSKKPVPKGDILEDLIRKGKKSEKDAKPYKREGLIVKPKVDMPDKKHKIDRKPDVDVRSETEENGPRKDSVKIKVYDSVIPGVVPPRPPKERREHSKQEPEPEIRRKRGIQQDDFSNKTEIPLGRRPDAIEIIPYETTPEGIPYRPPRKNEDNYQHKSEDWQRERQKDEDRSKRSEIIEEPGLARPLPDSEESFPFIDDEAQDKNKTERFDSDKKLEIRSFDEEMQSETSDEIPPRKFRTMPDNKMSPPEIEQRIKEEEKVKEEDKLKEEILQEEYQPRHYDERKNNDNTGRQNEPERKSDEEPQSPNTTRIRVYDGSIPKYREYDGRRSPEVHKIVPYEAKIPGQISMRSSLKKSESGAKSNKTAKFASDNEETDEEEEEKVSLKGNNDKKKQSDPSDKPPPGGAAGPGGTGRSSMNQRSPKSDGRRNSNQNTQRKSQDKRNSYSGRKRNDDEFSAGFYQPGEFDGQTVEALILNGRLRRRRGDRKFKKPTDDKEFIARMGAKELIGDQKSLTLPILECTSHNVLPGLLNDDHMLTTMRKIGQAFNSQEMALEYSKSGRKDGNQIKAMNDWKGMFEQYRQAYSVLINAKRDYEEKYEFTLKELERYKADYETLRKVNTGAEGIVDEISALKKLNSALEQQIKRTSNDLKRKELEKTRTSNQELADNESFNSMESLRYMQKISDLESKISFLTKQNEAVLRKYEESQKSLTECEKNLKMITEKMLKPPKDLIIPLIPSHHATYKDWSNYSKYITEQLNNFQVALARSNFMLKLTEGERDKLKMENEHQKCALQSSFDSLRRVQSEQNDECLKKQVELLTQKVEQHSVALKRKEEESIRLIEENRNLSLKVTKMEETVRYYRRCVERLNFMKEGISRLQPSVPEEIKYEVEEIEHDSNQLIGAQALCRRPNNRAIGLTSSALHKIVSTNNKRIRWNLFKSAPKKNLVVKKPSPITHPNKVGASPYDSHEFKLLHDFLQKEISKCIGKIQAKGCPQTIRQELEEIKNNLEWSKRKVNEMLGKKQTNDQNPLQLRKVCQKMIQSGAESLNPNELADMYNIVHSAGKGRDQEMKKYYKEPLRDRQLTGMKKWKNLEADINLTQRMLDQFRSGKNNSSL